MIDNLGDDLISGGSSSCTCRSKGGFRRPVKEGGASYGNHQSKGRQEAGIAPLVCLHVFINAFPTMQCVTRRVCLGGSQV